MAKHTVPDIVDEGGCESHVCLSGNNEPTGGYVREHLQATLERGRRARLNALFFHLYGLDREAVDYVLGTSRSSNARRRSVGAAFAHES
jgi:hypothetical protein